MIAAEIAILTQFNVLDDNIQTRMHFIDRESYCTYDKLGTVWDAYLLLP